MIQSRVLVTDKRAIGHDYDFAFKYAIDEINEQLTEGEYIHSLSHEVVKRSDDADPALYVVAVIHKTV